MSQYLAIEGLIFKSNHYSFLGQYSLAIDTLNKIQRECFDEQTLFKTVNRLCLNYLLMGDLRLAKEYLREAEKYLEYTQSIEEQVMCINNQGVVYRKEGLVSEGLKKHKYGLELQKEKNYNCLDTLLYIGIGYSELGYTNKALIIFESILDEIYKEESPDFLLKTLCYKGIAGCKLNLNDKQSAIIYCEKSIKTCQTSVNPEHPEIALLYANLGFVYSTIDQDVAQVYFRKSLKLAINAFGFGSLNIGMVLDSFGIFYQQNKEYLLAFILHSKSLMIYDNVLGGGNAKKRFSLMQIGKCQLERREVDSAIYYIEKSIEIAQKHKWENQSVFLGYVNLSNCYIVVNKLALAKKHALKALKLKKEFYKSENISIALSLHNLGYISRKMGVFNESCSFFEKAIKIYLEIAPERVPNSYNEIGVSWRMRGDFQKSLFFYKQSFAILRKKIGDDLFTRIDRENELLFDCLIGKSKTLMCLYLATRNDRDILLNSLEDYKKVLKYIDFYKRNLQTEESKFFFTNLTSEVYEDILWVTFEYVRLGQKDMKQFMYNVIEQSKATLLLNRITKNNLADAILSTSKGKLVIRELNQIGNNISDIENSDREIWDNQYFEVFQDYISLQEKIKYESQIENSTEIVDIENLQNSLIQGQALIQYFIGAKLGWVFIITKSEMIIEEINLSVNFQNLIENHSDTILFKDKSNFKKYSFELFETLIEPIFHLLEGIEELIIIRDSAIAYLPFEALLYEAPPNRTKTKDLPYLINKFAISYHFSATLWYRSVTQEANNQNQVDNFIGFVPLYGENAPDDNVEPQEGTTAANEQKQEVEGMRTVFRNGRSLLKLEYAEKEVEEIGDSLQKQGYEVEIVKEDKATVQNFIEKTQGYKYVVVSGHGFYDAKKPELSGIVFTPDLEKKEEDIEEQDEFEFSYKNNDAMLYVSDAYILKLDADLVVLSCCESGVGQMVKGEGVLGINRGFLYSGARNIIYTLFKVPDKASYQLTKYLFEGILEGQNYKTALRNAKLRLIQEKGIEPVHWAGYVLIGK